MVLVQGLSFAPDKLKRPFWMVTEDRTEFRPSMVTIFPLIRRTSRESEQLSAAKSPSGSARTAIARKCFMGSPLFVGPIGNRRRVVNPPQSVLRNKLSNAALASLV